MCNNPDTLMIFAAGFGTRMGALTRNRPKPLIEVCGKPLLDHALDQANAAGLETIVANAHYHADQIVSHLAPKGIAVSMEIDAPLDTGGGLKRALPLLGHQPVFTLNSDAVWTGENPLIELVNAWDPGRMDALLLLIEKNQARGHTSTGDFMVNPNGHLTRGPGHVYSGAQIIKTDRLRDRAEDVFSLNVIWDEMLVEQSLFGIIHHGAWCDVGHPGGIQEAETLLAG